MQQPKTAGANSELDKTWGQGQGKVKTVDRFGEGVVVTIANASGRRLDARLGQSFGIANGHVLRAAVGMINQPSRFDRLPIMECLVERIERIERIERCSSMKEIIASMGVRARPGQNAPSLCVESHSPDEAAVLPLKNLHPSATSLGRPARLPLSTSTFFTHSWRVCAEQPILAAMEDTEATGKNVRLHAP